MTLLDLLLARASLGTSHLLLLAQDEEPSASYGIAFFLVIMCIILGVFATVRADKRESDVKR